MRLLSATKIKALQDGRGWTDAECGGRIGVSQQMWSKYKRGKIRDALLSTANRIADAFGVEPEAVIDDPVEVADPAERIV